MGDSWAVLDERVRGLVKTEWAFKEEQTGRAHATYSIDVILTDEAGWILGWPEAED